MTWYSAAGMSTVSQSISASISRVEIIQFLDFSSLAHYRWSHEARLSALTSIEFNTRRIRDMVDIHHDRDKFLHGKSHRFLDAREVLTSHQ